MRRYWRCPCLRARWCELHGLHSAAMGEWGGRGSSDGPELAAGWRAALHTWSWGLLFRPLHLRNEPAHRTGLNMEKAEKL